MIMIHKPKIMPDGKKRKSKKENKSLDSITIKPG